MNNSAVLQKGTQIAKNVISSDIVKRLGMLMEDCIGSMRQQLEHSVNGMTGNTRTSPAGAVYSDGSIVQIHIVGETDNVHKPLSPKLSSGNKWTKGSERYDETTQKKTFEANIDTTRHYVQQDNLEYLNSQQGGKDLKMLIGGGTEYAGLEQVLDNFAYCQNNVDKFFK